MPLPIRSRLSRASKRPTAGIAIGASLLAGVCAPPAVATTPSPTPPDAVIAWNANAGDAALAACIAPFDDALHESRMYAMTHVAIHDALNAIDRRSEPYALDIRGPRTASPEAAVAAAARDVLVPLLSELPVQFSQACRDAGIASVEADFTSALGAIPEGPAKAQGVRVGRAAAATILAIRSADGSDTPLIDEEYVQGIKPGEYRFTPDVPFVVAPEWADVTPFVLRDSRQFRPGPTYALISREYARDVNEIKRLGSDGITTPTSRTKDQTQIASFWDESSPLSWNRIARTVAADREVGLWENARLFGLLNLAMADGYVGSWEAKYFYNFWRPVTAIRLADTDGNPRTVADPTWTPFVTTPPIPDHDSGHAVQGGAASKVLKRFFGTDRVSFSACSRTLPEGSRCTDPSPVFRRYRSFSHAGEENAVSRIYIGFHFRKAVVDGIEHGRRIGNRAANRFLTAQVQAKEATSTR